MKCDHFLEELHQEVVWIQEVINKVIGGYLMHEDHGGHWMDLAIPDLTESESPYASFLKEWELDVFQRIALAFTITTHLRPEVFDVFLGRNQLYDRRFTEFGGVVDTMHHGFLPTGQSLCFLLTALNPEFRLDMTYLLGAESRLLKEEVLILTTTEAHIPSLNGVLSLNKRWFHFFVTGEFMEIEQGVDFPAQKITTQLEWEDFILDDGVMTQIMEINSWLNHGDTLMNDWGLGKVLKPGYKALLYGPPGTGKTLAASLLGKANNRDVYRVDLSMIVSKYIGETEKNLARLFNTAEDKDWILFFDEADALFGKRTAANSSNDRHANQQTAFLLQRIEDFPGTVLLASNLKANMDEAFTRRFQAMIQFKIPTPNERYQLWKNAFSGTCQLDPEIDLWKIAENYEISGGSIINVLRYCALSAIERGSTHVEEHELISGLRQEFKKRNKTLAIAI